MDDLINSWCDKYGFEAGKIAGYRGGYPIVEFTVKSEHGVYNIRQKELDRFARRAEMGAGMEVGVGPNFRRTSFIQWNGNRLVICGHSTVIDRILKFMFHK